MKGQVTVIVAAGGSSSRMGFDKLFCPIGGKSALRRSVEAFCGRPDVRGVVVAARRERLKDVEKELEGLPDILAVTAGGAQRQDSVLAALAVCPDTPYIAVHDAARPFVSREVIDRVFQKAFETGAAAPAVPVKDTVKYAPGGEWVKETPDRRTLYAVQTPQVFRVDLYRRALQSAQGREATDDCMLLEAAGIPVALSEGDYANYKITTPEDIPKEVRPMRVGHGYDVHRLTEGRELILGGEHIPFEKGLLGHSDADVLTHAVMDALLGAAALGDIGMHFPDSDPAYAGADSVQLLKKVAALLRQKGWRPVNLDATIVCQRPRLAPWLPAMRERLAAALALSPDGVNIKATTEEGLGFTGSGEGVAAHCVAMLEKSAPGEKETLVERRRL
ncbi:MAG: 2-C-methyl-D-erythritol 2,4-cyclodiphosphate synthase [Oscillospiraceae bacterium]|nr:2-C-methyl-D-erythritol 2,4-cyclodiphosphate synthase [Oscillospiraceae bacterium]